MGTVLHVVPHTHWDREWYEPFEGYRLRLVKVVDRLLEVLESEPAFHFHFDGQTAAIEDYLAVRPETRPRIEALVRSGRLTVGPWRILMDEFLCSPETILRNVRQGIATAAALGASPSLGYIPDSFGHVAQMPQILALAGMTDACVWRGAPLAVNRPAFWWVAPDGTRMRTLYLATSYSNAASLPESVEDLIARGERIVADMAPFKPDGVVLAMNGTDHRGLEEHLPALFQQANASNGSLRFRIGSLREYLAEGIPSGALPEWHGEMRSSARANLLMGVCSARMPLKQAEFEASAALERYAEPLVALSGFDPGTMLEEAWRGMVENSAHDSVCGCGIDAVADAVLDRYRRARRIADLVADEALRRLAERIDRAAEGVLVFNPSPFERAGVAEATVPLPDGATLVGEDGAARAVQVLDSTEQIVVDMRLRGAELARLVPAIHSRMMGTLYVNKMELLPGRTRTLRLDLGPIPVGRFDVEAAKREVEAAAHAAPRARFHVIGTGPPLDHLLFDAPPAAGLGWTTLLIGEQPDDAPPPRTSAGETWIQNEHLRLETTASGRACITDLSSGVRLDDVGLLDSGDAGDEYTWCPPKRDTVITDPVRSDAMIVHAGPLEARLRMRQTWRIPSQIDPSRTRRSRTKVPVPVTIEWALRAGELFVRLDVRIENTASDHRMRLRVPLPFRAEGSDADTAFAVTRRGLQAEGGPHEAPTPSFPTRRWVDVSDGTHGLCVMHRGTPEYELTEDGTALEITLLRSVGWLSRQDLSTRSGPAGPALPAPGAQCPGIHEFSLALMPHGGDWRAAEVHRWAERFTYPVRATHVHRGSGPLPAHGTALSIEPAALQLSALEWRAGAVEVRVYNACDEPVRARLTSGPPLEPAAASVVGLVGDGQGRPAAERDPIALPLRPWEIATVRLKDVRTTQITPTSSTGEASASAVRSIASKT